MRKKEDRGVDGYLKRIGNGDSDALGPLYDCTNRALYALCFTYFRNRFDSEDALSDTYLKVMREIGKYNGASGFAWMCTIARNICLNRLKQSNRIVCVDFDDEQTVNALDRPDKEPDVWDGEDPVLLAEKVLNETEFRILIQHAVSGRKFREIAEDSGKIEATVRWQYNNALKKVRKEYEKRGRV